ncbi:MAG: aldolase [Actinobacteria bacterium]|nr:MAG: aldolase [Actinomycetota bacterium]
MRENPVRRRLDAGEVVLGTMVTEFATPAIARLTAAAGAEFTLFDLEHSGYGIERMRNVLAAARGADTVPFLRVPDAAYDLIARGLDLGAMGVMVPAVESVEEAGLVVESARFPPVGRRGLRVLLPDEWEPEGASATLEKENAETLVIVQIETTAGLETVDEIAAVDGIDILWIGHFDLTASLGIPGDFENPRYRESVDRVLAAGAAAGKPVGMVCGSVEEGAALVQRGFRILAYSFDIVLYEDAVKTGIASLRAALR